MLIIAFASSTSYDVDSQVDPLLYKMKYKGKNALVMFFAVYMLLNLAVFLNLYKTHINDETKYHDAKVYYVAGMIPQGYNKFFGRFATPLHPAFYAFNKPAQLIQEYLFDKGSKLIPDTDAEKELWEYEWFYYPYMIRMSDMYDRYHTNRLYPTDDIKEKTHNYMFAKLERLYEIMKILNEKKIADPYRDADALKKLPLMGLYYENKSQWFFLDTFINKLTDKQFLLEEKYIQKNILLVKWLQAIPDKLDYQMKYQEWGNAHLKALLKIEATRQQVVLFLMQTILYQDIRMSKFSCNKEITKEYINLRNRYMVGGKNSILDCFANNGGKEGALIMYNDSKNSGDSEFFRLILKKYCLVDVIGKSKYTSDFIEKNELSSRNKLIKKLNKIKLEGKIDE